MTRKTMKAPTLAGVNASELLSSAASTSESSLTLPVAQAAFFARIGLDATRARLAVEHMGWRA